MTDPVRPTRSPRGFLAHVGPALLYVGLVFCGGSLTAAQTPDVSLSDKWLHLLGFGLMQVLMYRAVRYRRPDWSLRWQLLVAVGLAALIGGALEVYQMALAYRSAELLDWVADAVGALLAAGVLFLALRSPADDGAAAG